MNCSEFKQQLQESIETHQPPAEAVHAHSSACDSCRRLGEEYVLLDRAVAAWKTETPSTDLVDAVLAQHAFNQAEASESKKAKDSEIPLATVPRVTLRTESRSMDSSDSVRRSNGIFVVLTAAALVTFVIMGPLSPPAEKISPTHSTVVTAMTTQDDLPDADVEAAVRDASAAYLSLAQNAAGVFSDTVVLIPEPMRPPLTREADNTNGVTLPEWGKEFEPIRRDVTHALEFLMDVLVADPDPAA